MKIAKIEQLIAELLAAPSCPLDEQQKQLAYEYAVGLFAGRLEGASLATTMNLRELQAMHVSSQKMTFYLEYFTNSPEGQADAKALGVDGWGQEEIASHLLNTQAEFNTDELKQIASRSADWSMSRAAEQLGRPEAEDGSYTTPARVTLNYDLNRLLHKAEATRRFRQFYAEAYQHLAAEPDQLLAKAKQALLAVHIGRLNSMAAVDVLPKLLSLEEQITRSQPSPQASNWLERLADAAPAIGRIHGLTGEQRLQAREAYARHLDAIRQGAPFELDEVDGAEANLFAERTLAELVASIGNLSTAEPQTQPTELAKQLQGVGWNAQQIKDCFEAVLTDWGILSQYAVTWQDVDDRDGFAPDEKFQVVITPRRNNLTVDSTRRIVNIPESSLRPLVELYPAGALPLIAHELSHVLQAYADYQLGLQIPLARIKGRRYRILREAGGAYQEKVICRDYFGLERKPNLHYLRAYIAKASGANRLAVARAFYRSFLDGRQLSSDEDLRARQLAVNRTSRLYRRGGHDSQVLDYLEQEVVCNVLLNYLTPEQVNTFLLGSTSFSLEDSAELHRFGLLSLPATAALSPAHEVMRVFDEQFRG